MSNVRNIHGAKQLFFDNNIIEMVQDVTRVFHSPQRVSDEPLIQADQPWEHITYFQCTNWTLLHDDKENLFKCWYENWSVDTEALADASVDVTDPRVSNSYLCYAASTDGIKWEKPPVGIEKDHRRTNIVFGDGEYAEGKFGSVHAATVLDDPSEQDRSKRYKMIFQHITVTSAAEDAVADDHGSPQILQSPIKLATSPDGIRWQLSDATLDFGGLGPKLGDVISLSYDTKLRRYVLCTRHPHAWKAPLNPKNPRTAAWSLPYYPNDQKRMNKRRIFQCESTDLIHWNEPHPLLQADDDEDVLDDSFYGMRRIELDDGYLGLLNVFHSVANTVDVQLVYSRDGRTWRRLNKRQPFFTGGRPGRWDEFQVFMSNPVIEKDGQLWIYYAGSAVHHDWWAMGRRERLDVPEAHDFSLVKYGLGLAKLRLDGFVSLQAGPVREGPIITHPLAFTGEALVINARCRPRGYVDIEVVSENDDPLPGLSRSEFNRFTGDDTNHTCTWQAKTALNDDLPVKLRIYMRNADLYSLNFTRP